MNVNVKLGKEDVVMLETILRKQGKKFPARNKALVLVEGLHTYYQNQEATRWRNQ